MPIYGAPDALIDYVFIAVSPFDAEHPIGSGTVVHYAPGDQFPGEDWGMAGHNLVEVGKAIRLATNVEVPSKKSDGIQFNTDNGGGYLDVETTELTAQEVNAITSPDTVTSYPVAGKAGWFELSDGSKIRGEEAAIEAQKALDDGGSDE